MISKRVKNTPPSGIREFFDLVLGTPDVISLGVGEPDFVSPWRIREKAVTSLEEGFTSYTSNKGLFSLRQEIAVFLKKTYGLHYDYKKEILITFGVSEGFDLALRTLLDPGDKVIVVAPYYVAYPALVELNLGKVLYLSTRQEDNFKIDLGQLKKLLNQNPKALILNYPSNPTGTTYTKDELKEIQGLLKKKKTLLISDEIYDALTYDFDHTSFASLPQAKERTILLGGFSKNYAMTGFRVGFACATQEIIDGMTKIHAYSALCAPITSQIAAREALKCQKDVEEMKTHYRRRRDFIVKGLNQLGLDTVKPQGAFYCFPSIKRFNMSSLDFAKKLFFQQKVAAVPGRAFGKDYNTHLRVSYANTLENLKEALIRIEQFVTKLK